MTPLETYQQVLADRPELLPYHNFLLGQAAESPSALSLKDRLTGFVHALLVSHNTPFDDLDTANQVAKELIKKSKGNSYLVTHLVYPDSGGEVVSSKIFEAQSAEEAAMQAAKEVYSGVVPLDRLILVTHTRDDVHHASFEVGVAGFGGFLGFKNYFDVARVETSAAS
ncbi:hypothetical protein Dxin01_00083 [Deinococcus xinjiangensis]|uniref:Uncharacterized protein n=1 Tax=Deinococcus xinjiangensis TaxID=457454 RepID=A0ABP9V9J2_9DEIO